MKRPETQLERLETASMFLKKVAVSFVERRPRGLSAWQADAQLHKVREAVALIASVAERLKAGEQRKERAL